MIEYYDPEKSRISSNHWLKGITFLDSSTVTFMSHPSCWKDFQGLGVYTFTLKTSPHMIPLSGYRKDLGVDPNFFLNEIALYKVGAIFIPYPFVGLEDIKGIKLSLSFGARKYDAPAQQIKGGFIFESFPRHLYERPFAEQLFDPAMIQDSNSDTDYSKIKGPLYVRSTDLLSTEMELNTE